MKKKKETPYHYYVIKLENPPNKCLSKYLCVRRSWTHKADEDTRDSDTLPKGDYGRVQAWYPFEMTAKRVKSHAKPDLNEGAMYMARIKYKTDLYKDAKSWIFLMQKSEKNKQNNEQNAPLNEWTAETNVAGGDQSMNEEELTSISENCYKQDKVTEIPDSVDLVIIEDSKDHEPVTSSSSPNITQSDPDTQKNDDIINCLLDSIQSLLKEVKRERNEQLRIEFDGMRIVRICDNNLLDRLARITVTVDNISYEVHATENMVTGEQKEAEVDTERTKTPEDAPASTSSPMASVPQASRIDQSVNSMQEAATRLEYVAPSSGRTTHIGLPSIHAESHELPVNAPRHVASSTPNYTSETSSNVRSLRQNSPAPMAIDSPYVIVEPSHPMSDHPSHQISVRPAVISSTNCISIPQNVCPTVTVRSPDEINNRAMSQNSNPNNFGSAINQRTYHQNSNLPIVYSNVTSDDRVSSEFPLSQTWVTPAAVSAMNNIRPTPQDGYRSDNINKRVTSQNYSNVPLQLPNRLNNRRCSHHTPAVITPMAMTNVPQDSYSMVDSVYKPDEINQTVMCQNSSNVTQQCADRLSSRRYSHQTSVTPAVVTSMGTSNIRPQDLHPHMESLYSQDEVNNRVTSQNSSNVAHQVANHLHRRRHSHIASATLAVITSMPMNNVRPQDTYPSLDSVYNPDERNTRLTSQNSSNVTLQIANHSNSRRYSHQSSATPAVITSMGMTNARPSQQNPIMDSVYNPDERSTRVTSQNAPNVTLLRASRLNDRRYSHQSSTTPAVISSVATSRSKPQSSRPKVGNVSPEVTIIPRYFNSSMGSASVAPLPQNSSTRRVDLELNDTYTAQESSIPNLAAFASYNDYFVRSLTQNQFNTECSRVYDSPSGSRPADQTGSRKRVHFSMTREPFPQNGHIPMKKSLSPRHSILQKERSESGVVILDE